MSREARTPRWELLIVATLLGIDVLVGWRAVQRLVLHQGTISPDAPFFVLFLLGLQVALLAVFAGWKRTLAEHERLRGAYEHELELTRQVMESVDIGISVADTEGRFQYLNRASCELLGYPREELIGQHSDALILFPTAASRQELYDRPLATAEVMPVTIRRGDGTTTQVRVRVTPRWHGGRIVGSIASISTCPLQGAADPPRTEALTSAPVTSDPVTSDPVAGDPRSGQ